MTATALGGRCGMCVWTGAVSERRLPDISNSEVSAMSGHAAFQQRLTH